MEQLPVFCTHLKVYIQLQCNLLAHLHENTTLILFFNLNESICEIVCIIQQLLLT